jgi:phosphatidate cytidylyltransferase
MVTGMLTRTITGVVGAAIMLTLFTLPFPVPLLVVAAIWLIAIYELGRAVKAKPVGIVFVALMHLVMLALLFLPLGFSDVPGIELYADVLILLVCFLSLILSDLVMRAQLAGKGRIINYCWHSFVFISLPLCWAVYWYISSPEPLSLILLLGLAAANDTGAVAAGKLFGSRRIVPRISPGKTLEGIIGGLAAMFAFIVLVYLMQGRFPYAGTMLSIDLMRPLSLVVLVVVCAFFAFVGFIGDITFSAIKRSAGIKDFGAILPGHGGILDRIDSLLFIAPWYFLILIILVTNLATML